MSFNAGELQGKHTAVYVESDATPGLFEIQCLFEMTSELSRSKNFNEYTTRDCTQPKLSAKQKRIRQNSAGSASGTAHIKDKATHSRWESWDADDSIKNVEIRLFDSAPDEDFGDLVGHYEAPCKLTITGIAMGFDNPLVRSTTLDTEGGWAWVEAPTVP